MRLHQSVIEKLQHHAALRVILALRGEGHLDEPNVDWHDLALLCLALWPSPPVFRVQRRQVY